MMQVKELQLTSEWDKVFPQSDKVNHRKVTFVNRYGIKRCSCGYPYQVNCYFYYVRYEQGKC